MSFLRCVVQVSRPKPDYLCVLKHNFPKSKLKQKTDAELAEFRRKYEHLKRRAEEESEDDEGPPSRRRRSEKEKEDDQEKKLQKDILKYRDAGRHFALVHHVFADEILPELITVDIIDYDYKKWFGDHDTRVQKLARALMDCTRDDLVIGLGKESSQRGVRLSYSF
jgi:hypothetical protein